MTRLWRKGYGAIVGLHADLHTGQLAERLARYLATLRS